MAKNEPWPLRVECPKCHAPKGEPCISLGTLTGEEPAYGSFTGLHKQRKSLAEATPKEKVTKTPACQCTNHMGSHKSLHKSRVAAVQWALRSPRVRGMRMEPYRCPTSGGWHLRTARQMAGGAA